MIKQLNLHITKAQFMVTSRSICENKQEKIENKYKFIRVLWRFYSVNRILPVRCSSKDEPASDRDFAHNFFNILSQI